MTPTPSTKKTPALVETAKPTPALVTNTPACFSNDTIALWFSDKESANEKYGPIGAWRICNLESINNLFEDKKDFNEDLSDWKTGDITTMKETFEKAESFNGKISDWDTSRVKSMEGMF